MQKENSFYEIWFEVAGPFPRKGVRSFLATIAAFPRPLVPAYIRSVLGFVDPVSEIGAATLQVGLEDVYVRFSGKFLRLVFFHNSK